MAAVLIVTLYEGKAWCLEEHLSSVAALEHEGLLTVLSVDDSYRQPEFSEQLRAFTERRQGIYAIPPPEVQPERGRVERVCALYNWVIDLCRGMGEYDHYLFLEDDVTVASDFLGQTLPLLADETVAAVSGRIRCRREIMTFGKTFCYDIIEADMLDDGGEPTYRLVGGQEQEGGSSEVGTNAFACLLARKGVVDRIRLVNWLHGLTGFDFCASLQLRLAGYRQLMAWDVPARHYYRTPGGEVRWI